MLDEVRELLKKIDQIVESESNRLNDQIDELKSKLHSIKSLEDDYNSLLDEAKKATKELNELKQERLVLKTDLEKYAGFEDKIQDYQIKIDELNLKLSGLLFTSTIISQWIPSQKENIDVLVALASSSKHSCTLSELHERTMIPVVTLKNRVLPLLANDSLVKMTETEVFLTVNKSE